MSSNGMSSSLPTAVAASSSIQQNFDGRGNSNSKMEIDDDHVDHKPSYHWEKQYGMPFVFACIILSVCCIEYPSPSALN